MTSVRRIWRSGWAPAGVALVALVVAATLLWWRGPEWGRVLDAFQFVIWSWIVLALLLNVLSTFCRAYSWRLTIGQALPAEHQPRVVHVFSSFGVGLLANAVAGWWWADVTAALAMVPWILKEGIEALRGGHHDD